jgi:PAS domain S-box-containing protein
MTYQKLSTKIMSRQMNDSKQHPLLAWDIIAWRLFGNEYAIDNLTRIAAENKWANAGAVIKMFTSNQFAVVVTNAQQQIQYVNQAFAAMTEYEAYEVLHKHPSFLQQNDSRNTAANTSIGNKIKAGQEAKGQLVNYRKSGIAYNCSIHIIPLKNKAGKIVNYIAFEKEVA